MLIVSNPIQDYQSTSVDLQQNRISNPKIRAIYPVPQHINNKKTQFMKTKERHYVISPAICFIPWSYENPSNNHVSVIPNHAYIFLPAFYKCSISNSISSSGLHRLYFSLFSVGFALLHYQTKEESTGAYLNIIRRSCDSPIWFANRKQQRSRWRWLCVTNCKKGAAGIN